MISIQQLEEAVQLLSVLTTELNEVELQHNYAFNDWWKAQEGKPVPTPDSIRDMRIKVKSLERRYDAQLEIVRVYRAILEAQIKTVNNSASGFHQVRQTL